MTTNRHENRNGALDGMRGYAAAIVVVYHTLLGSSPKVVTAALNRSVLAQPTAHDVALKLAVTVFNGEIAVGLFFVMSGLVLFRMLSGMAPRFGLGWALTWRFLVRRVLRLWPPMAICLVVHTLVLRALAVWRPGLTESHTLAELLQNLSYAHASVIGATWTLAVEVASAPLLLACFVAVRHWGGLWTWAAVIFVVPLLHLAGALAFPAGMLTGLTLILAGGLLAGVLATARPGPKTCRLALIAGVMLCVGDALFVPLAAARLHLLVLIVGTVLIVGAVASGHEGRLHRLLNSSISRLLGRISFSLYLWNVLIWLILLGLVGQERTQAWPLAWGLAIGVLAVVVTIPVALMAQRWTEQPFNGMGRMLTRVHGRGADAQRDCGR